MVDLNPIKWIMMLNIYGPNAPIKGRDYQTRLEADIVRLDKVMYPPLNMI